MNSGDLQPKPIAHSLQYQHCSRVLNKEIISHLHQVNQIFYNKIFGSFNQRINPTDIVKNEQSKQNKLAFIQETDAWMLEERKFLFIYFFITNYGCRHGTVSGHLSYHIDWRLVAEWGQHTNRAKAYKISNIQKKVRDYTLRISLETGSNCSLNQNQVA